VQLGWPKEPNISRMTFLAKVILKDNLGYKKAPPTERLRRMREWRQIVKRTVPLHLCPALLEWEEESGQHQSQMTPMEEDEGPKNYINATLFQMCPPIRHLI
jgi:hypothetical protein